MVQEQPALVNVKVFGTDGDKTCLKPSRLALGQHTTYSVAYTCRITSRESCAHLTSLDSQQRCSYEKYFGTILLLLAKEDW